MKKDRGKDKNENEFSVKKMLKFFLLMLISFVGINFITSIIGNMIGDSIHYYKYGYDFLLEFGWLICIVVFILTIKKGYIFTQKGMEFKKSLLVGLPIILFSCISLVINLFSLSSFDFFDFINLILYSLSIGMVEEFLCRGWLQNKFVKRFGKSYKQILLSIILSSLVFGLMHLSNIAFQGFATTISQIVQATVAGVFLGAVYYRTKNIWTVVFLHAFYDFSLLISELDMIKGCTTTNVVSNGVLIFELFGTLLMVLFYLVSIMLIFRKDQVEPMISENYEISTEESKIIKKQSIFLWICVGVLLVVVNLPMDFDIKGYDDYYVCYEYPKKEIDSFITHYHHKDNFEINYYNQGTSNNYNLKLSYSEEDWEFILYNKQTNYKVTLDYSSIYDYEIIENVNDYSILIYDYDGISSYVYYTKIDKSKISNDNSFLDNIKDSFKKYDLPQLDQVGYLTVDNSSYKYPLMTSTLGDKFIIDETGTLYLVDEK